ncbi:MAG: electron transport complex subunit E [Oscillospiraceae bacterium]|nr:electron transport complex subunit E [Oscillospiraceae bacterium]
MKKNKYIEIFDGLFKKNPLFVSGFIIAPVVACCYSLKNALLLIFVFSVMTFLTVLISTFIPRNFVYTLRIILYTAIASVVFVPIYGVAVQIFGERVDTFGFFLPLLVTNSMISLQSELIFYKMPKIKMIASVFFYIVGFDMAVVIFSVIRELLAFGTIFDKVAFTGLNIDLFSMTCGGFILLGLVCGVYRRILIFVKEHNDIDIIDKETALAELSEAEDILEEML